MTDKRLSEAQLEGLKNLWTDGIHSHPIDIAQIKSDRATLLITRALAGRGVIRLSKLRGTRETLELTGEGHRLARQLGWTYTDATPTIEDRLERLKTTLKSKQPTMPEVELLIATSLHWGRQHASELLNTRAAELKSTQPAQSNLLRDVAREIDSLTTRFENGRYVSRPKGSS